MAMKKKSYAPFNDLAEAFLMYHLGFVSRHRISGWHDVRGEGGGSMGNRVAKLAIREAVTQ
jgi:hypothetical protein